MMIEMIAKEILGKANEDKAQRKYAGKLIKALPPYGEMVDLDEVINRLNAVAVPLELSVSRSRAVKSMILTIFVTQTNDAWRDAHQSYLSAFYCHFAPQKNEFDKQKQLKEISVCRALLDDEVSGIGDS